MKTITVNEAETYLAAQKKRRRWVGVVILLALLVAIITVVALKVNGIAMNHKKTVMACTYQVHQHTDDCYDDEGNLICGYADYVVHQHDANCYDEDGNLICTLPEVEEHTHTDACYGESQVLVCGLEESAGHVHDDSCYTWERGDAICGYEEHTHTDACYDEEGNLICGYEEHVHTDDCYSWTSVLTCGMEEGEGAHTHTADCYETQYTLICDKPEVILHTHTDDCYDEDGNLICGMLQTEEHQHTADCLRQVDMTEEEVAALGEEEDEGAIFITTEDDETEEASEEIASEESASEEPASDELSSAEPAQDGSVTRTYEDDIVVVTVTYTAEANIPDDAELRVTHFDADSEEYQNAVAETGEDYAYLFDVGFWVGDEEIEPAAPVEMTINVKGDDTDYSVTHFAESGTEMVDSELTDDGEIVCELDSFSLIGLGTSASPYIIQIGDTETITGSGTWDGYNRNDSWTSSNTSIATVTYTPSNNKNPTTATVKGISAGTVTITHTYYNYGVHTETFTLQVKDDMVYVSVYATDGYPYNTNVDTSQKNVDTSQLQKILGLTYKQDDGYYPVGVIQLPKSMIERYSGDGTNYFIRTEDDMKTVLEAISSISTDELINEGAANKNNTVASNLQYVQKNYYDGTTKSPYLDDGHLEGTDGSLCTALFHWANYAEHYTWVNWRGGYWRDDGYKYWNLWQEHYDKVTGSINVAYHQNQTANTINGNADGTTSDPLNDYYAYHLDLRFATATIQYIGVYADGEAEKDGSTVDLAIGVYLAGYRIDEPEVGNLKIPDTTYTTDGYFYNYEGAYSGNGDAYVFGGTMEADTTTKIYIRLVKETKVTVTKQWTDEDGKTITPPDGQTVELTLYRTDVLGNKTAYRTITLDGTVDSGSSDDKETAAWEATFNHLPKRYKDSGGVYHYYTYSVEETAVKAEGGTRWAATVTPDSFTPNSSNATDSFSFTLTNKQEIITLTIAKQDGTTDPATVLTGAQFTLTGTNSVTGAAVSLTSAESATEPGTYTIARIPNGTYTLTETTPPAGYEAAEALTVTVTNGDITVTGGDDEQYTWNDAAVLLTLKDPVDSKEITFQKTDMTLQSALAGAQFTLTGPDDLNVTLVSGSDGKLYKLKDDGTAETEAYQLAVVSKEALEAEGKTVTQYTLTETKAPDGYYLLSAPLVFYYDSSLKKMVVTSYPNDISNTVQNMFKASGDVMTMSIPNSSGTELPATGGIGTTIFYIVGGVLVIGAGVVLVTKSRMRRRGDSDEE